MSKTKPTKFILGPGRLSFPKIFKPNAAEFGGKYAATILLPPEYDFAPLKKAMFDVAVAKFGADKSKWPRNLRGPNEVIRDCAEKSNMAGYLPGWHFLTASSVDMPGVVDASLSPVTDEREAYAGRWIMMSVNVYAYSNVTHGVSLGLQNIQLRKHDDPFSSRVRAEDEFEAAYEEMSEFDRSGAGGDFTSGSSTGGSSAGSDWD
ncbi:hypothetical protein [Sinorhizobium phage phiM5]|nr:hypothetical protein [Sinorhizobium phage phiM5]